MSTFVWTTLLFVAVGLGARSLLAQSSSHGRKHHRRAAPVASAGGGDYSSYGGGGYGSSSGGGGTLPDPADYEFSPVAAARSRSKKSIIQRMAEKAREKKVRGGGKEKDGACKAGVPACSLVHFPRN